MPTILQEWVTNLDPQSQEIILFAIRNQDGARRGNYPPKNLHKLFLRSILTPYKDSKYSTVDTSLETWQATEARFLRNWHGYSRQYTLHFMRATMVIGYFGSVDPPVFSDRWRHLYEVWSKSFNNPKIKRNDEDEVAYRLAYENDDHETMKHIDEKYLLIDREKRERRKQQAIKENKISSKTV